MPDSVSELHVLFTTMAKLLQIFFYCYKSDTLHHVIKTDLEKNRSSLREHVGNDTLAILVQCANNRACNKHLLSSIYSKTSRKKMTSYTCIKLSISSKQLQENYQIQVDNQTIQKKFCNTRCYSLLSKQLMAK